MTREEAIKVLNMVEAHGPLTIKAKEMAIKALEEPEIIRCKDCYWWTSICDGDRDYCSYLDSYHKADFYCAVGRRREE